MNKITDAELKDFLINGVVKLIKIHQQEGGKFTLDVQLTWKEGNWTLVSSRGTERVWASLDRLVKNIQEKAGGEEKPSIHLYLNN